MLYININKLLYIKLNYLNFWYSYPNINFVLIKKNGGGGEITKTEI